MVNYSEGKIYKVVCDETDYVYYGSTVQKLSRRLQHHKSHTDSKIFNMMTKPKIYLVEDYPCERKEQLLRQERFYIESNECINRNIPTRTVSEYYNDNKQAILLQQKEHSQSIGHKAQKEHYQRNKERYNAKHTCECGGKYTHSHKSSHLKTKKHIKFINN